MILVTYNICAAVKVKATHPHTSAAAALQPVAPFEPLVTCLYIQKCVCYDWLAPIGAVAFRKLAIPFGTVRFAPLPSHRNNKLPKITHLRNEFPSAAVWYTLLPGMPPFNWSAQQPTPSLESHKVVRPSSGGQEGE